MKRFLLILALAGCTTPADRVPLDRLCQEMYYSRYGLAPDRERRAFLADRWLQVELITGPRSPSDRQDLIDGTIRPGQSYRIAQCILATGPSVRSTRVWGWSRSTPSGHPMGFTADMHRAEVLTTWGGF